MKLNREELVLFFKQNIKTILFALVCSLFCVGIFFYYYNDKDNDSYNDINISSQKSQKSEVSADGNEEQRENNKIFIDVKGAVKTPGVYETTKEKRVKDIIEEAGGLLEEADTTNINLSQKLKDQMVIYILKKGEKPKQIDGNTSETTSTDATININTANKEQLMKISGVGKTKAEAIIEYREKNGEFKTKQDITKVKGIGKATFEKIKDKIEV